MGRKDVDEAPVLRLTRPDGRESYVPDVPELRDAIRQRERDGYTVAGERRRGDERDRRKREQEAARRGRRS